MLWRLTPEHASHVRMSMLLPLPLRFPGAGIGSPWARDRLGGVWLFRSLRTTTRKGLAGSARGRRTERTRGKHTDETRGGGRGEGTRREDA